MTDKPVILVVDDDASVRDSLRILLETSEYAVTTYASATHLLAERNIASANCIITDIRMPEMNGLDLQEELNRRAIAVPVIVITGHGDVALAVRAMKAGASDFIEKPFDDELLLGSVKRSIETGRHKQNRVVEATKARDMISRLTPREKTVLDQLVKGSSNKIAAHELGISSRTVELHRSRIMDKMNARSLSDVVRTALAAERHS